MKAVSYRLRALAGGLALAALIFGCSPPPSATPGASVSPSSPLSPLANSDWQALTVFGRDLPAGTKISLLFSVVQAGGFSGCNQFSTSYATEDTGLRFGPISGTRASCGETLDAVEMSYYRNLGLVTHYALSGDSLTLTSGTGETVLTYARMAPESVEGPWTITHVNNGLGAVSSMPAGVSANISFMPDGTVQGFGGCNNFSGGYSQGSGAANTIAIGPLMSTQMACGDPADTLERQLLTALQNSTKWSVTSGTLDLRDAGGSQQVQATTAIK